MQKCTHTNLFIFEKTHTFKSQISKQMHFVYTKMMGFFKNQPQTTFKILPCL